MSAPASQQSRLQAVHDRYRAKLIAGESKAVQQLSTAYGRVWDDLEPRVEALVEAVGPQFDPQRPYLLFREQRAVRLQQLLAAEMEAIRPTIEGVVSSGQRYGALQGREGAIDLIEAAYGDMGREMVELRRLPREDILNMVGNLQDGSPLREMTKTLGQKAGMDIRRGLITGMTLGLNPIEVARQTRQAFGGNLSRAMTVARTEMMRAHRQSTLSHFQENDSFLDGWVWQATLDDQTCMTCVMMHGTHFGLSEGMDSHPNCRCRMSPVPRNSRLETEIGGQWFQKLPPETQRRMMGPKYFDAWQEGKFRLPDLVGVRRDPQWGTTRSVPSLRSLVSGRTVKPPTPRAAPRPKAPARPRAAPKPEVPAGPSPGELREQIANLTGPDMTEINRDIRRLQKMARNASSIGSRREYMKQVDALIAQKQKGDVSEKARQLLRVANPAKAKPKSITGPGARDFTRQKVQTGFDEFNSMVGTGSMQGKQQAYSEFTRDRVQVYIGQTKRAYAQRDDVGGHLISLSDDAPIRTTIHELGHVLEYSDAEVQRKAADFFATRIGATERPKKLRDVMHNPGYAEDEVTILDRFGHAYMGKVRVIADGRYVPRELISMGMEEMYVDPVGFAKRDPDYFEFMVSVLRGL